MGPKVPTKTLSNGQEIPVIGLGTWKGQGEVVEQAVKDAIDVGYRHLDCALVYSNEQHVGSAIAAKIADGTVKREDLFVTTKASSVFLQIMK
jgi:diketogulonate reductase-like aldo/keto reductase